MFFCRYNGVSVGITGLSGAMFVVVDFMNVEEMPLNFHIIIISFDRSKQEKQRKSKVQVIDIDLKHTEQCNYKQNYKGQKMFPSVNKDDINNKIKERQWDDRLGNKGSIPEYSPLKDKHTKSYRKIITHKKEEPEPELKPAKATYFQKRLELVQELNQMHQANANLIEQFEEIAGKYKLPNFYIYFTLLPLVNPANEITQYLFKEKKEIKQQASHYHKISTAVRAREECLERLRKTLGQLTEEKLETTRAELREEVQHMRFLTENVIDEIKRWRDDLGKIDERAVYYTDAQQNYLIKILNDNKFIFSSKLAIALSFGQKNDPFLLVPVKRSEGKQASMFTQIVALTKDASHYQKYMEYLAGQKAYELSINPPLKPQPGYRNPIVEKVYKAPQPKIEAPQAPKEGEEDEGYKKMQLLKIREERLKKNQDRIKSIKSIYETYQKKSELKHDKNYRSEKKMPQTDNEDRRGLKKRSQSIKIQKLQSPSDIEFESLVKVRLEAEKKDKLKTPLKRSASHSGKSQQKMIQSLRDIQSTLRNKLQILQQQEKTQPISSSLLMSTSQQKFTKKTNEQLVKELKAQILSKIQKEAAEKERLKRLKRQQQQKALQQIKAKLKRQMEEKLEQKKKEKMLEREQLEKKLKEEEQRLNNQRQLELQLQLKLNKEKELRQLEKIKKEALEREKKYKEQLEKEQRLRKQREEAIELERREKEKLLEDIRKRQLKEQIEQQLRKQIKGNKSRDEGLDLAEQELIRAQKEAELAKEIEALKLKEGVQMQQLKKENQLRQRMLKLKREQQQLKRKQIEQLMRQAVQREKQQLQQDTMRQRIELQQRMRANVKEKLLQDYKNEKQAQIEKIKQERQKQMEEQVYRQKIREKIQREMRMEAIQRTKKDLEDREAKKIQARTKLEQVKSRFDKEVTLDKEKIQEDVKKQMIEKVILDKQAEREAAKYDLRLQFQRQLMASAVPQLYQSKQSSLLVKNINHYEGDLYLESKIQQLKPTNQKPVSESPVKKKEKGEVKPLIDNMTMEQLEIYSKQKEKVSEIKEEKVIIPKKIPQEQEGFQRLNIDRTNKEDEGYQVKVIKLKQSPKKEVKEKAKHRSSKKKKKKESSSEVDSEDEAKKKKHRKKQKRHYYDEESEDSQEIEKRNKRKQKQRRQQSEQQNSSEQQAKKSPKKIVSKPQPETKEFRSEQERQSKVENSPSIKPVQKGIQRQSSNKQAVVHFDVQSKVKVNQIQPITIKPQKFSNTTEKYKISLQAIPQAEFDQYLEVHMSRVTQTQLAIQIFNRQDLYRKLIGELTFCLLVGQYENRVVGQALAYHDRVRSDLRKFTIVHMATYKEEDLRDFILSVTNYIFRKDPCDEIEFHYKFNQGQTDQLQFSQNFNKWFDKYGSVFQKKVDDLVYERKYVLKRQFNQKCEVVLGGINKNIFRNLFSVYSGVLMSDTDMLQFKEELVDTLAPQNQICYSLMVSELFRTYLSPDQAEALKNKVKQYVKLKEMLILVVSMQKKKLKLEELKLYEYKNLIELNMRLMSQGKEIIRYCKDSNAELNRIYYAQLNQAFNLPFHFQTTSLPVQANNEGEIRQISYFRLSPLPPFKLHLIKSSLYNAQMNILPTENSKYKIFVMNAQEYNEIKESNHLDLFMYIRLFLKNVKSHNVAVWKYVWLPEMTDKGAWNLREFRNFLNKDFYTHDAINISYRQFLPGALIIEPEHRDLVITPPFIVGVMSMGLQQISEGSPLYARMIEINALKTIEVEKP